MSNLYSVLHWIRMKAARFARRTLAEPSHCQNCGAMSFEEWVKNEMARRWTCEECGYVHGVTFGGTWKATPPKEGDSNAQ